MNLKPHILPRLYQQTIISSCISNNSLVVLPTGLGKTIIAIMSIAHYLTKYPNRKVIFFAPTKPLCDQHYSSICDSLDIDSSKVAILTGALNPDKRKKVFEAE